jgi:hypothetical protein
MKYEIFYLKISTLSHQQISTLTLGEPLRAHFIRARVGLSAPSPSRCAASGLRYGGSATIPLALPPSAALKIN